MNENYTIAETFLLPSKGEIYGDDVNPEVTLRSMTTTEEMRRLAITDSAMRGMCDIIDACIVNDIGISTYDMCLGDYLFLLYKLRTVTYGSEYKISVRCPFCGYVEEKTISLDDMEIDNYFELIPEWSTFKLPKTGVEITLAMQTPRTLDMIANKIKEASKKNKNEDLTLLYSLYYSIVSMDGNKPNLLDLENWIRNLPLKDANVIKQHLDKLNSLIGIRLDTQSECSICHLEYKTPFRITDEFFNPTFDE